VHDVQDVVELEESLVDEIAVSGSLRFVHAINLLVRGDARTRPNTVQ
jgi:hypothetical protein